MTEHGPSERAIEAAERVAADWSTSWPEEMTQNFADAFHDPRLGLDRSVCLRDVLDTIWNEAGGTYSESERHRLIGRVERAFTESSSPDREGAE
jgi:hypothetical protein